MPNIKVKMKDGTVKSFPQESRPGGSYHNTVDYKEAFVVITDVWGKRTSIPAADVAEVEEIPERRW